MSGLINGGLAGIKGYLEGGISVLAIVLVIAFVVLAVFLVSVIVGTAAIFLMQIFFGVGVWTWWNAFWVGLAIAVLGSVFS